MSVKSSNTLVVERGLTKSDSVHIYNEMKKNRELKAKDIKKIKEQENEIKELKKIIKEKEKEKIIESCKISPIEFKNQIERKLLAIREEILKIQTEKHSLIQEAPIYKEK